jgi:hypothetical protein
MSIINLIFINMKNKISVLVMMFAIIAFVIVSPIGAVSKVAEANMPVAGYGMGGDFESSGIQTQCQKTYMFIDNNQMPTNVAWTYCVCMGVSPMPLSWNLGGSYTMPLTYCGYFGGNPWD